MRLIYLLIFIYLGQTASAEKIIKVRSSEKRTYKCQLLYFKDLSLIYELNFSSNGWQITDSISYDNQDSVHCAKVYFATYDEDSDSTSKPHYEYRYSDCNQNDYLKTKSFIRINDTYSLTKHYLNDLNLLLKLNPSNINDEFKFRKPVIPSILTKYGLPYNEQLSSFSFKLTNNNSFILNDSFVFYNYIVKRKYLYQNDILKMVIITVKNRNNGQTKEYSEILCFDSKM